jgi:hypothetical protein
MVKFNAFAFLLSPSLPWGSFFGKGHPPHNLSRWTRKREGAILGGSVAVRCSLAIINIFPGRRVHDIVEPWIGASRRK